MPMRQDCRYFESRTYPNGDTVRKCDLDLAPEAPWRCPDDCPKYTRRMADVNWSYGTLVTPKTPPEPSSLDSDSSIGDLLDAAEDIVNAAAPDVMADIEAERNKRSKRGVLRRKRSGGRRGSRGKSARSSNKLRRRKRNKRRGRLGERFRRRFREGG